MLRESSRLSLTTVGSSMNAAFGSESAGGLGRPELEFTQSGTGPCAFVATHPEGSAGGTTPSKASENCVPLGEHPGVAVGVGVGPGGKIVNPWKKNESMRQPAPA